MDADRYGGLRLTERSRPLLRGESELRLRRQRKPEKAEKKTSAKVQDLRPVDQPLFEALRALRLKFAQEQGVPPYVIFHDSSLREMAQRRPASAQELRFINGVGQRKLELYGPAFLDEIRAHPLPELLDNNLSDTVNETLMLLDQGLAVETIAERRELKSSTIYGHLAEAIEVGLLDARKVLPLSDAQYAEIAHSMELLNACGQGSLKLVFEALDEAYDYGVLKCVQAALCG